ncbi:MAG TPA: pyridoxamine 5'-phosphate oxidase [Arenimonas sp.]|nr:pyridoxamine 5'-phosphate oxidase [Arenimonas sp.]HOZ03963.1 pyridoxamine 5'-phosphate oxidase [Arenimonas sp.]HPO23362.1 pyridoxamine 5'-phosphate oxidase [Arenimonas sp.]HPW32757.1 pyridoxamine 5'-phosphate oxidase [Arenimonas sp.]
MDVSHRDHQSGQESIMQDLYKEALDTFAHLLERAKQSGDREPTAMTLATLGKNGRPSARTVLLKAFDAHGFVFYTNFESHKGRQLASNPQAALLFHWKALDNQIQARIEGTVEPVTAEEADIYFASRPRESQIGAWASKQSAILDSRETFDKQIAFYDKKFEGIDVPRPPHWSGFRVVPEMLEFWYGAEFRLHERQCYERVNGEWTKRMLFP